jgi:hypothetical protein
MRVLIVLHDAPEVGALISVDVLGRANVNPALDVGRARSKMGESAVRANGLNGPPESGSQVEPSERMIFTGMIQVVISAPRLVAGSAPTMW